MTEYRDLSGDVVYDSGFTDAELEDIFHELTRGVDLSGGDAALSYALAIGISDGDVIQVSERGTLMLTTPRAEIDRRVAAIRKALAGGLTLDQALKQLQVSSDGTP